MSDVLSPTMREALICARERGNGKLLRYPGGFWAIEGWRGAHAGTWFGTSTIEALVSRGVAEYTAWKERGNGTRFPIEMTVKP